MSEECVEGGKDLLFPEEEVQSSTLGFFPPPFAHFNLRQLLFFGTHFLPLRQQGEGFFAFGGGWLRLLLPDDELNNAPPLPASTAVG